MLGDHEYVAANAEKMIESGPADRKANTARLISESLLFFMNTLKMRN